MQQRGMSGGGGKMQRQCQQQRQQRCCHFQITPIYLVSYFLVYSKISLSNKQQQCLQQGMSRGGGRWQPPSCLSTDCIL